MWATPQLYFWREDNNPFTNEEEVREEGERDKWGKGEKEREWLIKEEKGHKWRRGVSIPWLDSGGEVWEVNWTWTIRHEPCHVSLWPICPVSIYSMWVHCKGSMVVLTIDWLLEVCGDACNWGVENWVVSTSCHVLTCLQLYASQQSNWKSFKIMNGSGKRKPQTLDIMIIAPDFGLRATRAIQY